MAAWQWVTRREQRSLRRVFRVESDVFGIQIGGPVGCAAGAETDVEFNDGEFAGSDGCADVFGVEGERFASIEEGDLIEDEGGAVRLDGDSRVSGGGYDSAPIGVAAGDGGFHEVAQGDRASDGIGIGVIVGPSDMDFDQVGRSFAIVGDFFRQFDAKFGEVTGEGAQIVSRQRGMSWGGSCSEQDERVVGAHMSFDADAVEGFVGGGLQGSLGIDRIDRCIGDHDSEHGGHFGSDHASSFAHTEQSAIAEGGARGSARDLSSCVGGHDPIDRIEERGFRCVQVLRGGSDTGSNLFHRQESSNDAGAHDQELFRRACVPACVRGSLGHLLRILLPLHTGACVGVAAVDDDASHRIAGSAAAGEDDGGSDDLIGGVDARGDAGLIRDNQADVFGSRTGLDTG